MDSKIFHSFSNTIALLLVLQSCTDTTFNSAHKSTATGDALTAKVESDDPNDKDPVEANEARLNSTPSQSNPQDTTESPEIVNKCGLSQEKIAEVLSKRKSHEVTILTPFEKRQESRRLCISWLPADGASHYRVVVRDLVRNEEVVFLQENIVGLTAVSDKDLQDSTYAVYVQPFTGKVPGIWARFTLNIAGK